MRTTIRIRFWERQSVVELFSELTNTGWSASTVDEKILYGHYSDTDELMPDTFSLKSPVSSWEEIKDKLATEAERGAIVLLDLTWVRPNDKPFVNGTFFVYGCQELEGVFDGAVPKLAGIEPFTDFNWYLTRVLKPFVDSGYSIEWVTCGNENT
ncbi:MAG: hypothetical protein ACLQVD_09865 [Capsulimonadaceae bacterium]